MKNRVSILSWLHFNLFGDYPNIHRKMDEETSVYKFMNTFSKAVMRIKGRNKTAVAIFTIGEFQVSYCRMRLNYEVILGERAPEGVHKTYAKPKDFLAAITLTPYEIKKLGVTAKKWPVIQRFRKELGIK